MGRPNGSSLEKGKEFGREIAERIKESKNKAVRSRLGTRPGWFSRTEGRQV